MVRRGREGRREGCLGNVTMLGMILTLPTCESLAAVIFFTSHQLNNIEPVAQLLGVTSLSLSLPLP